MWPQSTPRETRSRIGRIGVVILALLLAFAFLPGSFVLPGPASTAAAQTPSPRLHVGPPGSIVGQGAWAVGETVTVTIDDPDDVHDASRAAVAGDGTEGDSWRIDDDTLALAPGFTVTASDSQTTRTHVVRPIAFTGLDLDGDTVTGTTALEPGDWVEVALFSDVCRRRGVPVTEGAFTADFSVPGSGEPFPDELATCDLGLGTFGSVEQYDADGDLTFIGWQAPEPPWFSAVVASGTVQFNGFAAGSTVTVTIDGQLAGTFGHDECSQGCDGLPVAVGSHVEVSDGFTTKDHTVTNLAVASVDEAADTVIGTADPGDVIDVWHHGPGGNLTVVACDDAATPCNGDPLGTWRADFGGLVDLQPGDNGNSGERDADGDQTWAFWDIPPPPWFSVETPHSVWGRGGQWTVGDTVQLVVDTDHDYDLADPATYMYAATTTVHSWGPDQWQQGFDFHLDGAVDIQVGHIVTVTAPGIVKTLDIAYVAIDQVDTGTALVEGTAPGNAWVNVNAGNESEGAWRNAQADPAGSWTTDLAALDPQGDGDGTLTTPLQPGTHVSAQVFDDDNDSTHTTWCFECGGEPGTQPFDFFAEGDLIISQTDGRLWVRAEDGSLAEYPLPFGGIWDIQYADPGHLLIANSPDARIWELDLASGDVQVLVEGAPLVFPIGIAVDPNGESIYVADSGDESGGGGIYRFDRSTGQLTLIDPQPADGIAFGPDGYVYFGGLARVRPDGTGHEGVADLSGYRANGFVFDDAGMIVMSSMDPAAVLEIDPATGAITVLYQGAGMRSPEDVVIDPDGDVYVIDSGFVTQFGDDPGIYLLPRATLVLEELHRGAPLGDVVDLLIAQQPPERPGGPQGHVLISQTTGSLWTYDTGSGDLAEFGLPFGGTFDIQYLDPGTLWIAAQQNGVWGLDLASGSTYEIVSHPDLQAIGLAVDDPNDRMFISDEDSGVWRYQWTAGDWANGTLSLLVATLPDGSPVSADGLVLDRPDDDGGPGPYGWVYFGQEHTDIYRFDPDAADPESTVEVFAANTDGRPFNGFVFNNYQDLTVAAGTSVMIFDGFGDLVIDIPIAGARSIEDVAVVESTDGTPRSDMYVIDSGFVDEFGDDPALYFIDDHSDPTIGHLGVPPVYELYRGAPLGDVVDLLIAHQLPPESRPQLNGQYESDTLVRGEGFGGLGPLEVRVTNVPSCTGVVTFDGGFEVSGAELCNGSELAGGHLIAVSTPEGDPVREYTFHDVVVTGVDLALDTVSGTGTVGIPVEVTIDQDDAEPLALRIAEPDPADGSWTVSFTAPPAPGEWGQMEIDGQQGDARQYEDDGDFTDSTWTPRDAGLFVNLVEDYAVLDSWPAEPTTVTIYDAAGEAVLAESALAPVTPYFLFTGRYDLAGTLDLHDGYHVVAANGALTLEHTIRPIAIDRFDFESDAIEGRASTGAGPGDVLVVAANTSGEAERFPDVAGGAWYADFAGDVEFGTEVEGVLVEYDGPAGTFFFYTARYVQETVPPTGGTASSGDGDAVEVEVEVPPSPAGGTVAITEAPATGGQDGFQLIGNQIAIDSTVTGAVGSPLILTFHLLGGELPPGEDETTIMVFKDGILVPECVPVPDSEDDYPCVSSRVHDPASGDVFITVHTLTLSTWALGFQALTIETIAAAPMDPVLAGSPITATLTFTDKAGSPDETVTWDWGDGTTICHAWEQAPDCTVDSGQGIAEASHVYGSPGVYTITASITNQIGSEESAGYRYVVVYDPAGGFTTGGGWIEPEPGNAFPGVAETAKVSFGFNVAYSNRAADLRGQLNAQLGDVHVHSDAMSWLVITVEDTAHFQGSATIDGGDELYPFRVDVRDGDIYDLEPDRFVLTLWAPGADPSSADPMYVASGDLRGGQIRIHRQ